MVALAESDVVDIVAELKRLGVEPKAPTGEWDGIGRGGVLSRSAGAPPADVWGTQEER